MQSNLTIPYGRSRGEPIATCDMGTLNWAISSITKRVGEDPNGKFAGNDRRWLEEAHKVFEARSEGVVVEGPQAGAERPVATHAPARPAAPPSQALAKIPVGAIRDAASVTQVLIQAAELGNLVSPAPAAGNLPEGCSVLVSAIMVDTNRETYPINDDERGGAERGLSKVALDKIAGALGVDWNDEKSRRLDDGSHPHYCRYKAVGRVRDLDGAWRTIKGEKELDLRDDSAQLDLIRAQAQRKQRSDGGAKQIAQKRQHIQGLCETGARLRAILTLGLRGSYNAEELAKPFIVVKLSFDGRSEDPEIRKLFASRIADSFMGATKSLYGNAAPAPQLVESKGEPPPPLSAYGEGDEDDEGPPNYGFADPPKRTGTGGPY